MKKFPLILAIALLSLSACSPSGEVSSSSDDVSTSQEAAEHIYLNYSALTLEVGQKSQIKVYRELAAQHQIEASSCTFSSSTPSVAEVSSSGEISALAVGQSLITVTYEEVGASMLLTVKEASSSSPSTPVAPSAEAYKREGSLSASLDIDSGTSLFNYDYDLSMPVELSYTVDSNGHKDNSAIAFEFSPNLTASETGTAAQNFSFFEFIFNIQTFSTIVGGLLPNLEFDSNFPGQYKAMGAAYSSFPDNLSPYNEHFYLLETEQRSSFASYAEVEGTNMVRMQETWDSLDVLFDSFRDILDYLLDTDLSSVDYVELINQYIEDGELLTSSTSTAVQVALGVIVILINQFNITKTAVKVGNHDGILFRFHPKDETMGEINDVLPTLLENLGVSLSSLSLNITAMELSLTIYTDDGDNTCLGNLDFNLAANISNLVNLGLSFDYEMGHEKTELAKSYLTNLVALDRGFDKTASAFDSFYGKIEPVVAFYSGDAPSSGVDITDSYAATLQAYAEEYETLSAATKFMLTDKVSADTIMARYNEGRSSLESTFYNISLYKTFGFFDDYENVASLLRTLSEYKNWETAFKEYTYPTLLGDSLSGQEVYEEILTLERDYLSAITTEMASVTADLAAYDPATATASDSVTLFSRAYSVLCGNSNSLNYFALTNGSSVLSELDESVESAYASSDAILDSLYASVLSKFKAILDSDLDNQVKLDDLSTLLVGSGSTALLANYMTSRDGHSFISNGKRAAFVEDISETYTDNLLAMNEALVKAKRIEGYPLYGTEGWSAFVTSANELIEQVSSLERAIYSLERTDLSALRTLVAD